MEVEEAAAELSPALPLTPELPHQAARSVVLKNVFDRSGRDKDLRQPS